MKEALILSAHLEEEWKRRVAIKGDFDRGPCFSFANRFYSTRGGSFVIVAVPAWPTILDTVLLY